MDSQITAATRQPVFVRIHVVPNPRSVTQISTAVAWQLFLAALSHHSACIQDGASLASPRITRSGVRLYFQFRCLTNAIRARQRRWPSLLLPCATTLIRFSVHIAHHVCLSALRNAASERKMSASVVVTLYGLYRKRRVLSALLSGGATRMRRNSRAMYDTHCAAGVASTSSRRYEHPRVRNIAHHIIFHSLRCHQQPCFVGCCAPSVGIHVKAVAVCETDQMSDNFHNQRCRPVLPCNDVVLLLEDGIPSVGSDRESSISRRRVR